LEDNWRFTWCDACFAADVELLSAAAILGSGRHSWGFRLLGWRTALALGAFHHPAGVRFFPSLSWDALPGASKQDCTRIARAGYYRCDSSSSLSSSHSQRTCGYFGQTTMKKRLSILAVVMIAGLLALGWHFYGGGRVPAGQPPLVSLTSSNFDQLRTAFNEASGEVRIVLLLSPT
jgi:hypothetical protein